MHQCSVHFSLESFEAASIKKYVFWKYQKKKKKIKVKNWWEGERLPWKLKKNKYNFNLCKKK